MAIIDALGFDRGLHFDSIDYDGVLHRSTSVKMDGAASLQMKTGNSGYSEWVRHDFRDEEPTQPSLSIYIYPSYNYDRDEGWPRIRFLQDATTGQAIDLRWDHAHHTYDLYIDGSKVADGTVYIDQNDWFNLQVWAKIDPTNGFVKVKMDGHLSIDYSGCTQPDGATAYASHCRIDCGKYALTSSGNSYLDNWVLGENEYLGDCHVEELYPTSDESVEWTPITEENDNYQEVDEVTPDTADYVFAQTDEDTDRLGLETWDDETDNGITKQVLGVVAWMWSRAETATGESCRIGVESNGSVDDETIPQYTAHRRGSHVSPQNPDGNVDWDKASIDAMTLRYEADLTA